MFTFLLFFSALKKFTFFYFLLYIFLLFRLLFKKNFLKKKYKLTLHFQAYITAHTVHIQYLQCKHGQIFMFPYVLAFTFTLSSCFPMLFIFMFPYVLAFTFYFFNLFTFFYFLREKNIKNRWKIDHFSWRFLHVFFQKSLF